MVRRGRHQRLGPQWAGLIAVADQGLALAGIGSLGSAQAALYSIPASAFHDVTAGFNGYSATAGYDLVTGLGTPIANRLVADLLATQAKNVVGLPSPATTFAVHQGVLRASFVLSGGGSSGISSTTGTTASSTSTTFLFPVNLVVIIVPIGSGEIVVILPPVHVPASPFASTSHYVEAQTSLNPIEPGSEAGLVSALPKFGQGPAIGLPLPLSQRINPKDQIPSLLDLVVPIPAAAPKAPPRHGARQDRPEGMTTFPPAGLSILPLFEHNQTRQEVRRAQSPWPMSVTPAPIRAGVADRREKEPSTASMASTLAGVAAIAGTGCRITLRESDRRQPPWIPGRFDSLWPRGRRSSRPTGG